MPLRLTKRTLALVCYLFTCSVVVENIHGASGMTLLTVSY